MATINYWIIPGIHTNESKSERILRATLEVFNITEEELKGRSRLGHLVRARHFYIYTMCKNTKLSKKAIGIILRRDHSTVVHAMQGMENNFECDKLTGETYYQTTYDKLLNRALINIV